jgi:arylsulfatase A-like enzyme
MLKGYFAAVTAMDLNIGRILDKVLALGIDRETLICFFSDNGQSCGHHGFWGKGNGTYPQNMYEVTTKVPALFRHPGRIPEGRVDRRLASTYDVFPTLLDYLGLPRYQNALLPGRSLAWALVGKERDEREEVVVFDEYGPVRMIRTSEWKYIHRYPARPCELYDMVNDPEERVNLAADAGLRKHIADLKGRMEEWFVTFSRPEKDGKNLPVKGMGQNRPVGDDGCGGNNGDGNTFNPVVKEWFTQYEEGKERM